MSEGPEWFAPKHYGYGAGFPISWQGWLIIIVFAAIVVGVGLLFKQQPLVMFAILVPLTAVLLALTARTTRGGWRWRWGNEE